MYTDAALRKGFDPGAGLKGGPSESGGRLLTIRRETVGLDKWQRLEGGTGCFGSPEPKRPL